MDNNYCNLEEKYYKIKPVLHALSETERVKILYHIFKAKEISVNEIKALSKLSRPAISHHLKVLVNDSLISFKKVGTKNYYYLSCDLNILDELQTFFKDVKEAIEK